MKNNKFRRTIKKVLLIYPFTVIDSYNLHDIITKGVELQPPLGLGYISSYFKKIHPGIEIDIFDANAMAIKICIKENKVDMPKLWQIVKDKIKEYSPDLVGISCLFHATAAAAHKTAAIVKEIDSNIYTIIGGNYAHTSYDEVLKDCNIDFVCFGEGEIVLASLVKGINQRTDLQTIKGTAYINEMSEVVKTDYQELIRDVDSIPECNRSSFDIDFYSKQGRYFTSRFLDRNTTRITTLIASRGCPHRCTFCSARLVWRGKIRYRNPSLVVDEMLHLKDKFGVNTFYFVDDNMLASRHDIIKLADEISQRIPGINWVSLGGMQISMLKDDVVHAIYDSGCKWFILPIESGNPKTLKKIQKPHTVEMVEKVIEAIRKFEDTWIAGNIITGFPFESKEDIEDSLNYAKTLDLDWLYIFRLMPLPGTQIFQECLDAGYIQKYTWNVHNVGELSALNTPNFDAMYVAERNYAVNAEYNFFKNRNIKLRPMQAIKDFNYVLDTAKDNALAMYGIGCAYQEMKNYQEAEKWFLRTSNILESSDITRREKENTVDSTTGSISKSFFVAKKHIKYSKYFEDAGIDVRKCLAEVCRLAKGNEDATNPRTCCEEGF